MTGPTRVLVVGGGSIGERHVRCFLATGQAEVTLCEVRKPLREQVAERYALPKSFELLSEALAERPEAVVIATPAHLHIEQAQQAVEAGAHVLIEKPLSTSLAGIRELSASTAAKRVTVAVGYVLRNHPALLAMRAAVLAGRLGRVVQLVAVSGQHFPLYRPAYRETYYVERKTGGGAVQDALTHLINAGEWLVGPIDRVVADMAHQVLSGSTVEDTASVLARHGSVLACYSLNQFQSPNESTLTVVGTEGTARFELHEHRWRWMNEPGGAWRDEGGEELPRDALFERQAEAFLAACQGNTVPPCSLAEGLQTLRVNLAILSSGERGSWQGVEA